MTELLNQNSKSTASAYQLVIFDVDGTLVDSFDLFIELLNNCATKYHYQVLDHKRIQQLRGLPPRNIRKVLGLSWWSTLRLVYDCKKQMKQVQQIPTLFDGVQELILDLKGRGIQLAIVTSNQHQNCVKYFGEKLLAEFEWIECDASIYEKSKQIQKIIRGSKLPRSQILYVGDQIIDMQSAQKNLIDVAAVTWGFNHQEALVKCQPTYVLSDVSALRNLLLAPCHQTLYLQNDKADMQAPALG